MAEIAQGLGVGRQSAAREARNKIKRTQPPHRCPSHIYGCSPRPSHLQATFNLRGVMDRWPERAPLLGECLRQMDSDVLCFQEVLTGGCAHNSAPCLVQPVRSYPERCCLGTGCQVCISLQCWPWVSLPRCRCPERCRRVWAGPAAAGRLLPRLSLQGRPLQPAHHRRAGQVGRAGGRQAGLPALVQLTCPCAALPGVWARVPKTPTACCRTMAFQVVRAARGGLAGGGAAAAHAGAAAALGGGVEGAVQPAPGPLPQH